MYTAHAKYCLIYFLKSKNHPQLIAACLQFWKFGYNQGLSGIVVVNHYDVFISMFVCW